MTAPDSGEQIATELACAYSGLTAEAFEAAPKLYRQAWFDDTADLLPVVEAYATRKAAEAVERERAYAEGRWCGECVYGVVTDPPCCAQPIARAYAVAGERPPGAPERHPGGLVPTPSPGDDT